MVLETEIKDVLELIHKRRYENARELIDELILKDFNNFFLYYLKGYCFIYMNKLEDALLVLGEIGYLYPQHRPSMHALAFVMLQQKDFEGAVNKWLHILSCYPKDRLVKRNLLWVKKNKINRTEFKFNPDDFLILEEKEGLSSLLSFSRRLKSLPIPQDQKSLVQNKKKNTFKISYNSRFLITLIVSGVILVGVVFLFFYFLLPKTFEFTYSKTNLYSATPKEIQEQENLFQKYQAQKKWNQARLTLNQLLLSDLSSPERRWVESHSKRLKHPQVPEEIDFDVKPSQFLKNPFLYQGIWIQWIGQVKKLVLNEDYTQFNLLTADGNTIPVSSLKKQVELENYSQVQVFGQLNIYDQKNPILEAFHIQETQ